MQTKRLYIDIETTPTTRADVIQYLQSKIKAPKNYTKPETIAKYLADPKHATEAINQTALSGTHGQIACIGLSGDTGPVTILSGDELQILNDLRSIISLHSSTGTLASLTLVGHNVLDFDLPFLQRRMLVHQVRPLFPLDAKTWDLPVHDTMRLFCGIGTQRDMISLSELALALNVPRPDESVKGADVPQLWADGNHQAVFEHCCNDVLTTRAIYQHMTLLPDSEKHELRLTDEHSTDEHSTDESTEEAA